MNQLSNSMIWFVVAALFVGCSRDEQRKIRLASGEPGQKTGVQTAASVLQVSPEQQRSIAILNFENKTGDASLDWLRRGLTDMLVVELAQSPYITVIPMKRLSEIAQRIGKNKADLENLGTAQAVARETQAETMLAGRFYREGDKLRIDAELRDVRTGQVLRRETVRGPGLEHIFVMVNELSEQLRANLRGDLEAARVASVKLLDMTSSVEAFRCYSEALDNLEEFKYADAEEYLQQAIENDSTFAAAHLRLAFHIRRTDPDLADHAIRQAQRYAEKLSKLDRIRLRLFQARDLDDFARVVSLMEELLQYSPYDIDTRMELAGLLMGLQRFDRAIEEYEMVLEWDPDRKLAYNQIGYLYAYRGDFTTALKYLERYRQFAPDEHNPYDSMGEVLTWAGRLEEAAKSFKTALAKLPSFYQSAWNLTKVYSELGDLKQALKYSDKAMAAAPGPGVKSVTYSQRAHLYWRFGQMDQAVKAMNRALELDPYLAGHVLRAGEMYKAIGDTAAARQVYRSLFDHYKKVVGKVRQNSYLEEQALGFLLEADLPPLEVMQIADRILETDCGDWQRQDCLFFLGILYLRAGEYEKAARHFDDFWEIYEISAEAPPQGWGSGLKYAVEVIQLHPEGDSPEYEAADRVLEACKKAGRKDTEFIARFLRAQYHGKYGRTEELATEYRDLGSPLEDDWLVIGPFENRSGFHRQFPPEESIDLSAAYRNAGREIRWQSATDGAYDGYVNLREVLKSSSWAVGYGVVYINSPEKRVVQLRVGTDDASKLWLNDELVWQTYRHRPAVLDENMITVALRPGDNKLVIKVTNSIFDWGFYLRVTDENGEGYPDLKFHPPTGTEDELVSR